MRARAWLGAVTGLVVSSAFAADLGDTTPLPKNLSQQYLLDHWATPDSNFAYLDRTMVHYKDEGQGPAVLLIHGSLQDLYDWDEWTRVLKEHFRVVRFDMPSFGLTGPVGSGDYSMDNIMRLVDALMDRLHVARFALVGTSSGGVVAFRYAATRPDRVSALVLMNSAGVEWGNANILPPRRRYEESVSKTVSRHDVEMILRAVMADPEKVKPERIDRGLDYLRREGRDDEGAAYAHSYERGDPVAMLARIRAPTLVLWGGANRALAPEVADRFVALLTNAPSVRKVVLPGVGHWPHVEDPRGSVMPVEQFLTEQLIAPRTVQRSGVEPAPVQAEAGGQAR